MIERNNKKGLQNLNLPDNKTCHKILLIKSVILKNEWTSDT